MNEQNFCVPCIGIFIKLWDFDFANINDVIDNIKVNSKWANDVNISNIKNHYYDIHYFFNTLIKKGFVPDILT